MLVSLVRGVLVAVLEQALLVVFWAAVGAALGG
jgi:hypothetical protein